MTQPLTVECPCYRMDGTLWHEAYVPTGWDIQFHIVFYGCNPYGRCYPTLAVCHAFLAYRETIQGLLLAGF